MIDQSFISQYDQHLTNCILRHTTYPIDDYKQDIYLILLRHDFHRTNVKAYISKIVRNYFYSRYRKKEPEILLPDVTNQVEDRLILKDTLEFISKEHGECLKLYAIGYHYKEIAKLLNLSISAVKTRIYRLRRKLNGSRKEFRRKADKV